MADTALTVIDSVEVNTVSSTMQKITTFQKTVQKTLKERHDYGVIPGVSKPTLFKPGGEKICMMMGLTPEYETMSRTVDFEKGFFNYEIKCRILKGQTKVSEGLGSCNSKEVKYRYIWAKENEIPPGTDKDSLITKTSSYGKTLYKVENKEIFSLANTILKMAKKRAFIDAVLQVASMSEIFTQDMEDLQDFADKEDIEAMTVSDAANLKITFGKHKGNTLGELYKSNLGYVKWLHKQIKEKDNPSSRDNIIKKAIDLLVEAASNKQKQKKEQQEEPKQDNSNQDKSDVVDNKYDSNATDDKDKDTESDEEPKDESKNMVEPGIPLEDDGEIPF